ncbi:hypothetical protein BVG19_g680 [[Candida] boidinii]|nr:hypothetical protein BVG19_g680 [[Candida] boidinii]OWB49312.1 hypothetical protein B5S27_g852 [[Candida] boidinii]
MDGSTDKSFIELCASLWSGNIEKVKEYVEAGTNLNQFENDNGYNPLKIASFTNNSELVSYLLENGAQYPDSTSIRDIEQLTEIRNIGRYYAFNDNNLYASHFKRLRLGNFGFTTFDIGLKYKGLLCYKLNRSILSISSKVFKDLLVPGGDWSDKDVVELTDRFKKSSYDFLFEFIYLQKNYDFNDIDRDDFKEMAKYYKLPILISLINHHDGVDCQSQYNYLNEELVFKSMVEIRKLKMRDILHQSVFKNKLVIHMDNVVSELGSNQIGEYHITDKEKENLLKSDECDYPDVIISMVDEIDNNIIFHPLHLGVLFRSDFIRSKLLSNEEFVNVYKNQFNSKESKRLLSRNELISNKCKSVPVIPFEIVKDYKIFEFLLENIYFDNINIPNTMEVDFLLLSYQLSDGRMQKLAAQCFWRGAHWQYVYDKHSRLSAGVGHGLSNSFNVSKPNYRAYKQTNAENPNTNFSPDKYYIPWSIFDVLRISWFTNIAVPTIEMYVASYICDNNFEGFVNDPQFSQILMESIEREETEDDVLSVGGHVNFIDNIVKSLYYKYSIDYYTSLGVVGEYDETGTQELGDGFDNVKIIFTKKGARKRIRERMEDDIYANIVCYHKLKKLLQSKISDLGLEIIPN